MESLHQICKACGTALVPGDKFCPKCLVKVPEIEVLHLKDTSNNEGVDRGGGFSVDFSGSGDIVDFFGGGQRRHSPQPGADLLKRIQISPDDAVAGMDREIEILHTEFCPACDGTGNRSKLLNECPKCGGTGQITKVSHSFLGQFIRTTPCIVCRGTGKAQETICKECRGSGHIRVKRQVSLHIPAGITSGMRYRMEGWGECGDYGQKKGDLFVEVFIK
jgi:molecular chaperone DnaJ